MEMVRLSAESIQDIKEILKKMNKEAQHLRIDASIG